MERLKVASWEKLQYFSSRICSDLRKFASLNIFMIYKNINANSKK